MIAAIAFQILTGILRQRALEGKDSNFSRLHRVSESRGVYRFPRPVPIRMQCALVVLGKPLSQCHSKLIVVFVYIGDPEIKSWRWTNQQLSL